MLCRPALPLRRVLSRPFATSSWCFASHDSAASHPRGGTLLTRKLLACLPLIRQNAAKCFVVRPQSKLHFRRDSLTLYCSLWLHPTTALRALLYFEAPEKKRLESTLQIARQPTPPFLLDVESLVLVFPSPAKSSAFPPTADTPSLVNLSSGR